MRETLRYVSTHDERGRCNYDALSLAQDGIDSLPGNVRVVAMIGDRAEVLVVTETVGRIHRHIHFKRFGLLLSVSAAVCLSGCLTAAKIGQWQRAVYGWGMDPKASKPCQVASADASKYLANANRTLAEAGKLTDLASDSRARELVTSAALACGKEQP